MGCAVILRTLPLPPPSNIPAPSTPLCITLTVCRPLSSMAPLLSAACILCSLFTLGSSLTCMVCRTEGGEFTCTGEEKSCPKDHVCAATSTITLMEGLSTKSFSRSCEKRSNCGVKGRIVYYKGMYKTATSCCYTDSCSPPSPALIPDSVQRNGLSCHSCTSIGSAWCHTAEKIDCTGEEKKCILQMDTYSGKKNTRSALRGCGTKEICDMGNQVFNYGDVSLRRDITCTNNGLNLHGNLLLAVVGAFLAYRLML